MKTRNLLIAAVVLTLASCAKQEAPVDAVAPDPPAVATKAINSPRNASGHELLVTLDNGGILTEELQQTGVASLEPLFNRTPGSEELMARLGMDKWFVAYLKDGVSAVDAAVRLSSLDEVKKIQYNTRMEHIASDAIIPAQGPALPVKAGDAPFNDPYLSQQWSLINTGDKSVSSHAKAGADLNVASVWENISCGDPDIIVAVIDEGVKYSHPDLVDNMWTGKDGSHGYNFVSNGPITWDKSGDVGHGTHCAGIISAVSNNGVGITGVAGGSGKGDGVKLMSCQIFDGNTGGYIMATARAIQYAADNGASIISCSFGYYEDVFSSDKEYEDYAPAEVSALKYFESPEKANNPVLNGNIAIFAAGNNGDPHSYYPAALSYIVSVSSLGPDMLPAYYTNYGPGCNIAAPGGELSQKTASGEYTSKSGILSTVPSELYNVDYAYMQGTSQACPHVSGTAALGLSYAKKLGKKFTVQEFKNMLITAANDIDSEILMVGSKSSYSMRGGDVNKYFHKMGTGALDSWLLMMKIEGIPSVQVAIGADDWVDLSEYFGTAYSQLTYLSVEVLGDGKEALGLAQDPYIKYNRLFVHATRPGACKLRVSAIGGGEELGGESSIGGMEVSQDISLIARPGLSANGGWL